MCVAVVRLSVDLLLLFLVGFTFLNGSSLKDLLYLQDTVIAVNFEASPFDINHIPRSPRDLPIVDVSNCFRVICDMRSRASSLLVVLVAVASALNLERCHQEALGFESGRILDSQLSASSSFDLQSVGPQNSRIRTELNSGAWCPKEQASPAAASYIQVELDDTFVVRAVETQGRYGNGTGVEYPTFYFIDYQRPGSPWIRYRNRSGHELMTGNTDTTTAVLRQLDPPIIASRIRLRPYSEQLRTVCLRWELYGCKHEDGLMFYSASHKGYRSGDEDMRDSVFEDVRPEGSQLRGLGALYDGLVSKENPRSAAVLGNASWIGWSRAETGGNLEFTFEFDEIRNFSEVTLYCFGVTITRVETLFSLDGENFMPNSQILSVQRPNKTLVGWRHFPWVIPTHGRQGRFIKLSLAFSGDRFYLTEIDFSSDIAKYLVPWPGQDDRQDPLLHSVGGREEPPPDGTVIYTSMGAYYILLA
uniref:F5/8 type C domain-containing protein n=1 Tax=Steinernema glaseri TaxID=37863 RepID=A0A1I7YAN3_9BILA